MTSFNIMALVHRINLIRTAPDLSAVGGMMVIFMLICQTAVAQRIPVRANHFSVYEKEIEGIEWLMPAAPSVVRDSLASFLSNHTDRLAVFEDMILVESVRYMPVSVWQPITLLFLFDSETTLLTRVQAGCLINYQQSVTVAETPGLAIRFLLDMDQFTRYTTGDSLDFDGLMKNLTARKLLERHHARMESYKWNLYADRRREEVVEFPGLHLRNPDMFSTQPDIQSDEEIVKEVSLRFQQYVAASGESGTFLTDEEVDAVRHLRDSILQLQLDLVSSQEQINRQRQRQLSGSLPDTIWIRDSLPEQNEGQTSQQLQLLTEENNRLRQRLKEKDQEIEVAFLRLNQKEQQLASERKIRTQLLESEGKESANQWKDSLQSQSRRLRSRIAETDSLKEVLVILQPDSEEAQIRRGIYLHQRQQLYEAQSVLAEESLAISAREKRVAQRESFLAQQETSPDRARLLRRISELESALIRAQSRSEETRTSVQPSVIVMDGHQIPALSIRSELPASWTREQLLSWFELYDIPFVESHTQYEVVSSELPGMGPEELHWTIRISSREGGSIIYHLMEQTDGTYLDLKRRSLESLRAARMIEEIFR